jgi:hypothetical protein
MAIAASAAGEMEKAVAHAREAHAIRDPMMTIGRHWPDFACLRKDARFNEIMTGMGLN